MIYEMRRYECLPGRLPGLTKLMQDLAVPLFRKHGMTLVGAWSPVVGDVEATVIYILAFDDMNDWRAKWDAFYADEEWKTKRAEFAKAEGGPVVARVSNAFWKPQPYSPLQ
jgi:hypothetical protein